MLRMTDIEYAYAKLHKILDKISLSLDEGELLAIVGRNGCGKTTLTRLMMGLVLPDRGKIEIAGEDVTSLKAAAMAQKIGYVFQNPDRQLFANTVLAEVMYAPLQLGCSKEQAILQAERSLQDVGLSACSQRSPQMLSRGEKQRLSIASALAAQPKILILDEPTSGQDCRERTKLLRLMRRLKQTGMAIVLVTHDMDIVAEHADTILAIKDSKVAFCGSPLELFLDEALTLALGLELPEAVRISREMGLTPCLTPAEIYQKLERRNGTHD